MGSQNLRLLYLSVWSLGEKECFQLFRRKKPLEWSIKVCSATERYNNFISKLWQHSHACLFAHFMCIPLTHHQQLKAGFYKVAATPEIIQQFIVATVASLALEKILNYSIFFGEQKKVCCMFSLDLLLFLIIFLLPLLLSWLLELGSSSMLQINSWYVKILLKN